MAVRWVCPCARRFSYGESWLGGEGRVFGCCCSPHLPSSDGREITSQLGKYGVQTRQQMIQGRKMTGAVAPACGGEWKDRQPQTDVFRET